MNKAELIDAVTQRLGVDKRTANAAVEAVVDTIQRAVAKGEKVAITGFGVFEKIDRPARTARNPATGASVRVKKTSVPKFRAGSGFKDVVSGAKKLPKVADAAVKAAAKSAAGSARKTAGTAAAAPGKAASAATRAGKTAAKRSTGTKSAAKKTGTRTTAAKKTTGRATATKTTAAKSPARKTAAKKTAKRATKRA